MHFKSTLIDYIQTVSSSYIVTVFNKLLFFNLLIYKELNNLLTVNSSHF